MLGPNPWWNLTLSQHYIYHHGGISHCPNYDHLYLSSRVPDLVTGKDHVGSQPMVESHTVLTMITYVYHQEFLILWQAKTMLDPSPWWNLTLSQQLAFPHWLGESLFLQKIVIRNIKKVLNIESWPWLKFSWKFFIIFLSFFKSFFKFFLYILEEKKFSRSIQKSLWNLPGRGSGSAWIIVHFPCWIRISIETNTWLLICQNLMLIQPWKNLGTRFDCHCK